MKQLDSAVQEILLKNPKGLILDLRNNPGGLLDVSVEVANVFLPKDSVVVIERAGDGTEMTHTTSIEGKLKTIPMILLVNEGSASAAEIVAGALKDHGRATLIGTKTFGKGTVQTYEVLPDGSSLKLTVAEWFTPHNESFDGKGIEPDVVVEMSDEDYTNGKDPQMDRAREEFR
jgi:carboxyl-terminal processing protease